MSTGSDNHLVECDRCGCMLDPDSEHTRLVQRSGRADYYVCADRLTCIEREKPPVADRPMMACGHAANGRDVLDQPVCVICLDADPGAYIVVEQPNLDGRTARCAYFGSKCHSERPSSTALAFFELQPGQPHDSYYCGCYGWD